MNSRTSAAMRWLFLASLLVAIVGCLGDVSSGEEAIRGGCGERERDECRLHGFPERSIRYQVCAAFALRENRFHGRMERGDPDAFDYGHRVDVFGEEPLRDVMGNPMRNNNPNLLNSIGSAGDVACFDPAAYRPGPMYASRPGRQSARVVVPAGVVPCGTSRDPAGGMEQPEYCVVTWGNTRGCETGNGAYSGLLRLSARGPSGTVKDQLERAIREGRLPHFSLSPEWARSKVREADMALVRQLGPLRPLKIVDNPPQVSGLLPGYRDGVCFVTAEVYGDRYENAIQPGAITPPDSCGHGCVGQLDLFLPGGMQVDGVPGMRIGVRNCSSRHNRCPNSPPQHVFQLVIAVLHGRNYAFWVPESALQPRLSVVNPPSSDEAVSVPLQRLHHSGYDDYFYTTDAAEAVRASTVFSYRLQGDCCKVFSRPLPDTTPFFRLYHPGLGVHFYTINDAEANQAVTRFGYTREGNEGWVYSHQVQGSVPLYRLERRGRRLYTASPQERDNAIGQGFRLEIVEGYVLRPDGW